MRTLAFRHRGTLAIGTNMFTAIRAWLRKRTGRRFTQAWLIILAALFAAAFVFGPKLGLGSGASAQPVAGRLMVAAAESPAHGFHGFFTPFTSDHYSPAERLALMIVLGVAVAGLVYAGVLSRQVLKADRGTPRMQQVAGDVREGANAYLSAQFRKIGPLIVLIALALFLTKWGEWAFAFGRAGAFLMGSLFSWCVGFVGMRLATTGNLRVAAAARNSYGEAMQL